MSVKNLFLPVNFLLVKNDVSNLFIKMKFGILSKAPFIGIFVLYFTIQGNCSTSWKWHSFTIWMHLECSALHIQQVNKNLSQHLIGKLNILSIEFIFMNVLSKVWFSLLHNNNMLHLPVSPELWPFSYSVTCLNRL